MDDQHFGIGGFRHGTRREEGLGGESCLTEGLVGLAALFLLTDKPIAMPHGSHFERFATMMVFILTIGRCMYIGIFSSAMRQSLYKSGVELKEAYQRIEELAELDELTELRLLIEVPTMQKVATGDLISYANQTNVVDEHNMTVHGVLHDLRELLDRGGTHP